MRNASGTVLALLVLAVMPIVVSSLMVVRRLPGSYFQAMEQLEELIGEEQDRREREDDEGVAIERILMRSRKSVPDGYFNEFSVNDFPRDRRGQPISDYTDEFSADPFERAIERTMSGMQAIRRRATFKRSQTAQSGLVPLDDDVSASRSDSESSILTSQRKGQTLITVSSDSVSSDDSGSGIQPSKDWRGVLPREPNIISLAAFLECWDSSVGLDGELLCRRRVGHIINVSPVAISATLAREDCLCEDMHNHKLHKELKANIDHTSTPEQIMAQFDRVNKFISEARDEDSRVLIYYPKIRKSLGMVLGIQALMNVYQNLSVKSAIEHWKRHNEDHINYNEELSDNCMEALHMWGEIVELRREKRAEFVKNRTKSEDLSLSQKILRRGQQFLDRNLCITSAYVDEVDNC
ncbi:unnamed protein product [Caenorhabditis bovis]|uniref:Tyrosine-protein phosphatase domain-containing protein n=1 Tax=Caenorhabditis bovis TaxID=2654633 RepID=A0A8S1F5K4_9PELO|nr:unnamed protein product [Caenorhabditis bovis]